MGHRKLFHRSDTEALAQERKAAGHLRPQRPKTELVPANEMLEYIRERDAQLADMQRQSTEAAAQVGYFKAQLEQRLLPEDVAQLRQERDELKRERDELKARLEAQEATQQQQQSEQQPEQQERRPFWKRILRRS